MPFGKYKGKRLENVPSDYVIWLLNCDELRNELRRKLEAELNRRRTTNSGKSIGIDSQTARAIIEAGRRSLAKKYHPDLGGSNDEMQRVNAIADALLTKV